MDFKQLYEENFKRIYRFFFYRNVPESEIEDLVQTVFMEVYKSYFRDKRSGFEVKIIYGYAKNIYLRWLEKRIKEKRVELDIDELVIEDEEFSDKYNVEIENRVKMVREKILNLNEQARNVITARFIDGLTRAETAKKLGTTEDSVHTIQKRAIKYLKNEILIENNE